MNKRGISYVIFAIIVLIIVAGFIFMSRSNSNAVVIEPSENSVEVPSQLNGFCGESLNTECNVDSDCVPSGCSGQICAGVGEDIISTCEWQECYDSSKYSVFCGCVNNECQWFGDSSPLYVSREVLITSDGITIVGDYYGTSQKNSAALLVHMMPSDRKSFSNFAPKLAEAGVASLAIDLRGHGESQDGPNGYTSFSNLEHQRSIADVSEGIEFLKSEGYSEISIVGASIGANLALQYASQASDVNRIVLISPGLDYRGIRTESLAKSLNPDYDVFIIAALDDKPIDDESEILYNSLTSEKTIRLASSGGHGTNILNRNPNLEKDLISWLAQ